MFGGIVSSTGFTITSNTNTLYLDDDGTGNIRSYFLEAGTNRSYVDSVFGTIDYVTGTITLPSLIPSGVSNSDGTITITVQPRSNDVVPVRNQLLAIDLTNTVITGENDTIESGGSSAGTGYSTSSSY
jgi:hypothetical protein